MFPFDAPDGAAVYLVLLIATFAAHVALIGFVLGGAAWVLGRHLRGGDDPIAALGRDWLPFALGVAITFGVAPLLFIQVLYQPRLYTATLLLSHRMMAIVPVLVVGFYLLYAGKTARVLAWPRARRAALAAAALACFVFVAWTWVEAHVLATAWDRRVWVDHYGDGRWLHRDPVIARRLALWLGLAATSFAAGAGLIARARATATDRRRLGVVGLGGVAAVAAAALWMYGAGGAVERARMVAPAAQPWLYVAAGAAVVALAGFAQLGAGRARGLAAAVAGTAGLIVGVAVLREASRVDGLGLQPTARDAQGLPLFVLFLGGGAVAIALCVRVVRRHLAARDPAPT